ncbi:MAG: histidinol dehydrogenase [Bacteroidales bacterium]|nr:histidinol dehydrogenase [Bacteroidales bacterium]
MKIIKNPKEKDLCKLTQRSSLKQNDLLQTVAEVFENVKTKGDRAVKMYCNKFDKVNLKSLIYNENLIKDSAGKISPDLRNAIVLAKNNIEKFHAAQLQPELKVETSDGVFCSLQTRAIEKVGLYIPGGSAPLFSTVLMLGIPAKIAGCKEIVLCSPPGKNGEIHPAILFAANLVGIKEVFCVGGIQAIAAMCYGTESIPKTYKIFGPGNQYVTAAKMYAQNLGIAIDMPAGPSELLIIADNSSVPEFVAADLLSQAEHGDDSQVILLSNNLLVIENSLLALKKQLKVLPRKEIARKALKNSKAILLENLDDCISFSNLYCPEHLILAIKDFEKYSAKIINAGSVFLGNFSCESAGDYASGTNHTLPTNGFAKNFSGVSVHCFQKFISFQEIKKQGIMNIGKAVEILAAAENLEAHKNAVSVRLKYLENDRT